MMIRITDSHKSERNSGSCVSFCKSAYLNVRNEKGFFHSGLISDKLNLGRDANSSQLSPLPESISHDQTAKGQKLTVQMTQLIFAAFWALSVTSSALSERKSELTHYPAPFAASDTCKPTKTDLKKSPHFSRKCSSTKHQHLAGTSDHQGLALVDYFFVW